jgi:hypothetical protein
LYLEPVRRVRTRAVAAASPALVASNQTGVSIRWRPDGIADSGLEHAEDEKEDDREDRGDQQRAEAAESVGEE